MSTLTFGNRLNVFNIHAARTDRGETLNMAQNLAERNDLLRDLASYPANQGLTHKGIRWTTLPSGQRVEIGGTWGNEMGHYVPFVEGMFSVKSSFETPRDVLKDDDPETAAAVLDGHIKAFEEGLTQAWANLLVKGDSAPRQDSIVGLMQRAPYNALDNEFCFGIGGTGSNLRSAWLICPGINTVHLIHNKSHPTFGIEVERMPIQRLVDPDDSTKHNWIVPIEFGFQQGICIRDQKAVKRLANIPCGYGEDVSGDWLEALLYARHMHTVVGDVNGGNQWFLYCDGWLYAKLVSLANKELRVQMSDANVYQTNLPMIGDIVIRRLDALNYASAAGETVVS